MNFFTKQKVYCSNCKNYVRQSKGNYCIKYFQDTPLERIPVLDELSCEEKNKFNDCQHYREKYLPF